MSSSVHCNFCGVFPSPECTSFCLSNCGHIFCKQCFDAGRITVKCNRCGAAAPKVITIDRNLNPTLQVMFKKPNQLIEEHEKEVHPLLQFQDNQRSMRFKGQLGHMRQETERRIAAENQLTIMRDEMKRMQQADHERSRSRSRHSSREDLNLSRGGNASDSSHNLTQHHTMSSSVSSNETTYLDPFKTPVSGLKRYTTSTPKEFPPTMEGPRPKKHNDNSRLSHSTTAATPSFATEVDDDVMDVTPAPILNWAPHQQQVTPTMAMAKPMPRPVSSTKMTIAFDSILSDVPKKVLPKTPTPRKNTQSMSMAERLSVSKGPRPVSTAHTPLKSMTTLPSNTPLSVKPALKRQLQQPEVTSSTTPQGTPLHVPKVHKPPCVTPLVAARLQPLTPITPITPPIRPTVNRSQLPSSTLLATLKKSAEKASASAVFKTPELPVRRPIATPRTMPAGMKMGAAASRTPTAAAASNISQPHSNRP